MATNSDRHVKMFGQQLVRRHPLLPPHKHTGDAG